MYKNFSLNWGELTEKNCWLPERTEVRGLSDDLVDSMSVCLHTRYMLTTFPTMVHSIIIAKFEINFGIIRTWVGSIRLKDGIGSYKYLSTIRQLWIIIIRHRYKIHLNIYELCNPLLATTKNCLLSK